MGGGAALNKAELIAAARKAAEAAYAPYSKFAVGAALLFDDGAIVTASNVENASYGLALCAETLAAAKAMNEGRRGGLVALAIAGPGETAISPCGRCRQVLFELASLGGTDPFVYSEQSEWRLSQLLPLAFGPANLSE